MLNYPSHGCLMPIECLFSIPHLKISLYPGEDENQVAQLLSQPAVLRKSVPACTS